MIDRALDLVALAASLQGCVDMFSGRCVFRCLVLGALVIATLFCTPSEAEVGNGTRTTTAPAGAETVERERVSAAPVDSAQGEQREIYIDSVVAANPLVVRGRARTF